MEKLSGLVKKFKRIADSFLAPKGIYFNFTPENTSLIIEMIKYIDGSTSALNHGKGIFLMGERGIGKTLILTTLNEMVSAKYKFPTIRMEKLGNNYEAHGQEAFNILNSRELFLDDLLREKDLYKHYQSPLNIGQYALDERYEQWQFKNYLTHATCNGNESKLREKYDHRTSDALIEMSNLIVIEGKNWRLEK